MSETKIVEGVAIGRSGQISRRKEFAGMHFGVDVQLDGNKNYAEGVVSRAFKTEAKAIAFAERVNGGDLRGKGGFYDTARNAIVVPVWPTPEKDQPWPWETPEGKRALDAARKAGPVKPGTVAKTAKPAAKPAKRSPKATPAA